MLFQCRARVIEAQKETIEDAVTLSALSSSLIDLNEYGRYGYIRSGSNNVFDDEEWAMLKVFKENLQTNLNLDENMYPNADNGIITSQVKIVNFWVYNHEVVDQTDGADYNNNWSNSHKETDNYYILKYIGNDSGGYTIQNEKKTISASEQLYTPKDENIIQNANGVDAVGEGNQPVNNMTIYVTIEFEANPFGVGLTKNEDAFFGYDSLIGSQKILKSVVVDVAKNY